MRRQDWVILGGLLLLTFLFAWPTIREMPAVRYLAGDCEWRRGAPTSDRPRC